MKTNAENRGNAQLASHEILKIVNPALHIPKNIHDLVTRLEKGPTLRSQREILPSTLDEFDTKTTCQSAHLLAHSALRDAVHLRRLGETRGFRQIGKDFK